MWCCTLHYCYRGVLRVAWTDYRTNQWILTGWTLRSYCWHANKSPVIVHIQGEHKKSFPKTFGDISAIHEDFCLKWPCTIGSHSRVGSQALGEVCHRLVDVFLWQLFPDGLQGDFQLIDRLRLRLMFMVLFQHGAPAVTVQWVQIWRVSRPLSLLNEPVRVQSVLHDARTLKKWVLSWLKQSNLSFSNIFQPNLVIKCWRFRATICMQCWNINKSLRGRDTFIANPV